MLATSPMEGQLRQGDDSQASVRYRRHEAARACLSTPAADLPWKFHAEIAPLLLGLPNVREVPPASGELPLLDDLLDRLAKGLDAGDPFPFARCLAAAMFYFLPHELPLTPRPSELPLWLRVAYVRWSLVLPKPVPGLQGLDRYVNWLEGWLSLLHTDFTEGQATGTLPDYQRLRFHRFVIGQLELLRAELRRDGFPIGDARLIAIESRLLSLTDALTASLPRGTAPTA